MKLGLKHQEILKITNGSAIQIKEGTVDIVVYDTRVLTTDRKGVFFALKGNRDGHSFSKSAYEKGVRCFVVSEKVDLPQDASVILVDSTLHALQALAKYHRNQFSYPVLAITGSLGKTMIKEWLYFLIKDEFNVVRSPKSFNSQIGVAISLLEMTEEHNIAIIEADISHPDEMSRLEDMISPTLGIFTGVGKNYEANFENRKQHVSEHLRLFKHANITFAIEAEKSNLRRNKINAELTSPEEWSEFGIENEPFAINRALALFAAEFLGISREKLKQKVDLLPVLSNRQEVFEGQNGNLIINDTYNIDIDALEQSLEYQFSSNERPKKVVVLDLSFVDETRRYQILELVNSYDPDQLFLVEKDSIPEELNNVRDASILFKGSYRSNIKNIVQLFKNRKHETWVEFDLKAVRHNLAYLRSKIPLKTKILVMVKASSYGTGDVNIPHFLQQSGIDYLGVAYTDEGTTLRERGINLPVLIMNTELNAFDDLVKFCLEPSIYAFDQLDEFRKYLKKQGLTNYPIHLTFETGMNRLGFNEKDIPELMQLLSKQDEVRIKSVYSHLADADNLDKEYTLGQIRQFEEIRKSILSNLTSQKPEDIVFHILNSEGVMQFGDHALDMVRLGIGVFGYTSRNKDLLPCIRWKTTISQIKNLEEGETIGYGRSFRAEKPMKTATLRIGYADGFRRTLSNGVGKVFIKGNFCPVVGNVCMDMTMVDVTEVDCKPGDEVEIIGDNISMKEFADSIGTIPYEVMTSINKRVARVYYY